MPSLDIVAWIFVILGVVSFLVGVVLSLLAAWKDLPKARQEFTTATEGLREMKAGEIEKILKALADVLQAFGKLAIGIQWSVLGLLAIGIGAYLMNMPG